jgi:Calcineurin-like phosphoesterase
VAGLSLGGTLAVAAVAWAVGDGGDGSERAKRLASLIENDEPDRFLYLGDVYETGTAEEFRRNFAGVYGPLVRITSPTPGNHEWGRRHEGYFPYWRRVTGRRQRPWYRFELGGWEVFSLNSEAAHGPRSRQVRWLRRRLDGAEGDCRLAFWHRPRFSAGVYGDDASYATFWRALAGKARLVLSGHDHNMQRLKARNGIVQLVAGSGGRELYPLHDDPRVRFGRDNRVGALRLELRTDGARVEFRRAHGRTLDSLDLGCDPAPTPGVSARSPAGPPARYGSGS